MIANPATPTVTGVSPSSGPTTGGTSVTISGTNFTDATAVTFGGNPAASFTVNSATSITATAPAGAGTVNVTVGNFARTSTTSAADQFTYTAVAGVAPGITANPSNQTVNSGQTATFTASASGTPAPTVQWQISTDGGASFSNIAGATSTTLSFTTINSFDGNRYRAVFTNASGSATTTSALLSVNVAPTITTNPTNQSVAAGSIVTFSAFATGRPDPTVQWQVSADGGSIFSNIAGATSNTLTFTTAAGDNGKQFRAVYSNAAGSATSTAATLTIQTAPVITTQPVGATVAPGQSISVSAAATGNPTPSVTWYASQDGGSNFIAITNSPSFSLISPTPSVMLIYAVFTNAAGSATTNTVPLTWAKQNQTISFTSAPPAAATVGGPTYTVAATATSGLPVSFAIDASANGICSIAGSTVSFQGVGTCTINANQAGNTAYDAAPQVQQSFAVGQGANVITFPPLPDTPFTSAPPTPAATASSGLAVTYSTTTTGVCTVTGGGSIAFVAAGPCAITASQAGNATYTAASPVTVTFAVTPGINTITFNPLADRALGSGSFTVSASASSGLAVTFASATPATCAVSGSTVSLLAVGTCTVTANQAGNGTYQPAPQVSQSFQITQAVSSVTLTSSASTVFFGQPVTLTATVTGVSPSGSVVFRDGAATLGTVTLASGTATFTTSTLTAGAHQLSASYLGDARNLPSTSTTVAVTVNARPDPSQDPDTRSSIDTQFRTAERFARTQMSNIESRLDQLHNDGEGRDSNTLRFSQTRSRLLGGIRGGDGVPGYPGASLNRFGQPASGGDALLAALNPNGAWVPGSPLSMAPSQMGMAGGTGEAEGAPLGAAGTEQRRTVNVWASGDVNFGKEQPNGSVESRFTTSGVTVGIDGKVNDSLKLGAAIGFAWDNTRIGTLGSRNDATNGSLAFYGSLRIAPRTFLDGIVGMGYGTIDTTRFSTAGSVTLEGKRQSGQTFAALIGTVEARLGAMEIAPYLRADAIWVRLGGYTETGSPYWALAFDPAKEHNYSGTAGTRIRLPLDDGGHWRLVGKAEYRVRLSGDYTQLLNYADLQSLGGSPYAISGQGVDDSTFTGGLGIEGRLRNVMLRLNYDLSTLAGDNIANRISGGLQWAF